MMLPNAMFNNVNLVADPEVRAVGAAGKSICNVSVCKNESFKDKQTGKYESKPHFFDLEFWDQKAEFLAKYGYRGATLNAKCSMRQSTWVDKDTGAKRSKIRFTVDDFEFAPGVIQKSKGEAPSRPARGAPGYTPEFCEDAGGFCDDDGVPF